MIERNAFSCSTYRLQKIVLRYCCDCASDIVAIRSLLVAHCIVILLKSAVVADLLKMR